MKRLNVLLVSSIAAMTTMNNLAHALEFNTRTEGRLVCSPKGATSVKRSYYGIGCSVKKKGIETRTESTNTLLPSEGTIYINRYFDLVSNRLSEKEKNKEALSFKDFSPVKNRSMNVEVDVDDCKNRHTDDIPGIDYYGSIRYEISKVSSTKFPASNVSYIRNKYDVFGTSIILLKFKDTNEVFKFDMDTDDAEIFYVKMLGGKSYGSSILSNEDLGVVHLGVKDQISHPVGYKSRYSILLDHLANEGVIPKQALNYASNDQLALPEACEMIHSDPSNIDQCKSLLSQAHESLKSYIRQACESSDSEIRKQLIAAGRMFGVEESSEDLAYAAYNDRNQLLKNWPDRYSNHVIRSVTTTFEKPTAASKVEMDLRTTTNAERGSEDRSHVEASETTTPSAILMQ